MTIFILALVVGVFFFIRWVDRAQAKKREKQVVIDRLNQGRHYGA